MDWEVTLFGDTITAKHPAGVMIAQLRWSVADHCVGISVRICPQPEDAITLLTLSFPDFLPACPGMYWSGGEGRWMETEPEENTSTASQNNFSTRTILIGAVAAELAAVQCLIDRNLTLEDEDVQSCMGAARIVTDLYLGDNADETPLEEEIDRERAT